MLKFIVVAALLSFGAVGCKTTGAFDSAETTIGWINTGLNVADQGWHAFYAERQSTCEKADPDQAGPYQECMATVNKVKKYLDPALSTAKQGAKTAKDAIVDMKRKVLQEKVCEKADPDKGDVYKNCMEKYKAAVTQHLKNAGCLLAKALGFLPDSIKSVVGLWVGLLDGFGCSN